MAPDGTAGKVQRSRSQIISGSYDVARAGRGQLARPRGEQNAKSRGPVKLYRSLGRPFAVAQPQLTRFVSGLLPAPSPILSRNSEFCRQIATSMRTGWAGHLRTDGLHTVGFILSGRKRPSHVISWKQVATRLGAIEFRPSFRLRARPRSVVRK